MEDACRVKRLKLDIDAIDNDTDEEKTLEIVQPQVENENIDDSTETMKITDLNDECLQRICEYLDLIDLTNFAESNVRLAKAAKYVFSQMHRTYRIYFKLNGESITNLEWCPSIELNYRRTHGSVENMLKHFGKLIRRIKVMRDIIPFRVLDDYNSINLIAEHCRNTLIELECFGAIAYCFQQFRTM